MATSVTPETVTFFVPLMLVIVERLSNRACEIADDSEDLINSKPLFVPDRMNQWLPGLGSLNYLHATNMAVLLLSFVLITAIETQPLKNVIGLLVVIIWLQLPLLEVDAYGQLRDRADNFLPSLYFHISTTLLLVVIIAGPFESGKILESVDLFSPRIISIFGYQGQLIAGSVLVVLWLGSVLGFLRLLAREAESTSQNNS